MSESMTLKRWCAVAGCGVVALAACVPSAPAQQFALKDGDTVVFYGDSITAQRLYTRDVEEFVLTRYPQMHIRFVNAGVPGDTVNGGYAGARAERVRRDVDPYQPTMITVMLGMNDGGWGYGDSNTEAAFEKGLRAVLAELHKADLGAAITLISPTPYDEITHGTEFPGYSEMIDKFADDVARIGAELQASGDKSIITADFHRPMTDALAQAQAKFPALAPLMVPDRIHPAPVGHWIMASALMSAWHVDPIVSSLTLNAVSANVIAKDRTTVSSLQGSTDGLTWTQTDEALPLPLDLNNAMTPVLLAVSDIAKLDQLTLRVESLQPGQYELSIDGKAVATFSSEQLGQGVNLALDKTPMLEQAREIDRNEEERAALDRARFILSADLKETPHSALAEATLRQAGDESAATVRSSLQPHPHKFALRRKDAAQTGGSVSGEK
jgi:lysophospholipase L1-like esterase